MNDDARIMSWLSRHRDEAAGRADPSAHVDVDTLARHATGRLSPPDAQVVTAHLLVCDDQRCVAFVRAQAADVDAAADFLYPPEDEHATRPRTFMCKEQLWEAIEGVAQHAGLPIDEVINDAMLQYAHSRGYHEGPTARRAGAAPSMEVAHDAAARSARRGSSSIPARMTGSITTTAVRGDEDLSESEPSARSRASVLGPPAAHRIPAITPEAVPRAPPSVRNMVAGPARSVPPARRVPPPPGAAAAPPSLAPPPSARSLAPPSSRRAPPPLPSTPHMPMAPPGAGARSAGAMGAMGSMGSMSLAKRLVLTFEGRTYDVDKEHFIIGRSKNQADLRIDDANVSRQHAAIERIGSIYYLVDLGSTNGVYVGDDRVTRRALVDGDTITVTTHTITCRLG